MTVMDLVAKLTLDSSDYDKGLENAGNEAEGFGGKIQSALGGAAGNIKSALETTAAVATGAVTAAATGISAIAKSSVDSFKDYEQLVGGVETLYTSSSETVLKNAEMAYKTAGLSANEYMETATSFAAALVESTGRGVQTDIDAMKENQKTALEETKKNLKENYDATSAYWDDRIRLATTSAEKESLRAYKKQDLANLKKQQEEALNAIKLHNKEVIAEAEKANSASVSTEESIARAAQLADQAIIDMSDNANKMGTNIESIQNAYNGFAKGNFTINNLMSAA